MTRTAVRDLYDQNVLSKCSSKSVTESKASSKNDDISKGSFAIIRANAR